MLVALGIMWLVANIPLTAYHAYRPAHLLHRTSVAAGSDAVRGNQQWGAALAEHWRDTYPAFGADENSGPLMMAWYFDKHEATLRLRDYAVATLLLLLPVVLILRQPDLGTGSADCGQRLLCAVSYRACHGASWRDCDSRGRQACPCVVDDARLPAPARDDLA